MVVLYRSTRVALIRRCLIAAATGSRAGSPGKVCGGHAQATRAAGRTWTDSPTTPQALSRLDIHCTEPPSLHSGRSLYPLHPPVLILLLLLLSLKHRPRPRQRPCSWRSSILTKSLYTRRPLQRPTTSTAPRLLPRPRPRPLPPPLLSQQQRPMGDGPGTSMSSYNIPPGAG